MENFLTDVRDRLRSGTFMPVPVRERMIPKASGKLRRLGIPTVNDRVVQAALKLVLEPIFEADFQPCSYGFRPKRRAQDAIAEIHLLTAPPRNYAWVVDADISACFDTIDHTALLGRVRRRIGDKRVMSVVKAFCKAGILDELSQLQDTEAGTPQGGILSPLLANIALSVLDEHFSAAWAAMGDSSARHRRRRRGEPTYRLVRYADDFVVLVHGEKHHAEALRDEAAAVLAPMGPEPVGREDEDLPHRPRFRFPRVSHPASTQTRKREAIRLHLPQQGCARVGQGEGAHGDPAGTQRATRALAGSARSDPAGVGELLPTRGVQGHLRLPAPVHLAPGDLLVAPQAPARELEVAAPPLPPRVVAEPGRSDAVRHREGDGQSLPLPRQHRHALGDIRCLTHRLGLVESRMRGNADVRFGRRPGETDLPQGRHRAPGRPHLSVIRPSDGALRLAA